MNRRREGTKMQTSRVGRARHRLFVLAIALLAILVLMPGNEARRTGYRTQVASGRSAGNEGSTDVGSGRDLFKKFMLLRGMFQQQQQPSNDVIIITEPTTSATPTTTTTTTTTTTNGTARGLEDSRGVQRHQQKLHPHIPEREPEDGEELLDQLAAPTTPTSQSQEQYSVVQPRRQHQHPGNSQKKRRPVAAQRKKMRRRHKHKHKQQQQPRQRGSKRGSRRGSKPRAATQLSPEEVDLIKSYQKAEQPSPQQNTNGKLQSFWGRFQ